MLSYYLKYRKYSKCKNVRTKNGRTMHLSKCAVFDGKKSKFMEKQEVKELLGSLGIKAP